MKNAIRTVMFTCALLACGPITPRTVGDTVINCAQLDQNKMADLAAQLLPLARGSKPDWTQIKSKSSAFGLSVGGCVLADTVNKYLSVPRANAGTQAAYDTLADFRQAAGGNIAWLVNGQVL